MPNYALQTLPQFPLTDYTDPLRANPPGTLWKQAPEIPPLDQHVGGSAAQISKSVTGTVTNFDGSAVGWTIEGVDYSITGATDAPTFVALWNAKSPHGKIATASVPEAGKVKITLAGLANPAVAAYSPSAPDFADLVTVAGSDPKYVPAGTFVVRDPTVGAQDGAVVPPRSDSTAESVVGVAIQSNFHTDLEAAYLGWEPGRGSWPGSHLKVIPGGYPKMLIVPGSGAATAGQPIYCEKEPSQWAGRVRPNDGGTLGQWTFTFSAANGTDAVGAYFNGLRVALGDDPTYPGTAVNGTNATNFAGLINAHPVLSAKFSAAAVGAVATLTAKDATAWTITKYKPATSDVTVANSVPAVAATAFKVDHSRFGKSHVAGAEAAYVEFNV